MTESADDTYEGTEKRLELIFRPGTQQSQRCLSRAYWDTVLCSIGAVVLHNAPTQYFDAYLLSESSLFVYEDRIILLTCGRCRPFEALATLATGRIPPEGVEYTRVPFMAPELQPHPHRAFRDECVALQNLLHEAGLGGLLATLSSHSNVADHEEEWHCFRAGRAAATSRVACPMYGIADTAVTACTQSTAAGLGGEEEWHCFRAGRAAATSRVACPMYGIADTAVTACTQSTAAGLGGEEEWHCFRAGRAASTSRVACYMYGIADTAETACTQLTAAALFGAADPSACILHTHAFEPAGFSVNGAAEHGTAYWTMHVTPERACSYASFETNAMPLAADAIAHVVRLLAPRRAVLVWAQAGDVCMDVPRGYTASWTRDARAGVCVWTRDECCG